MFRSLLTPTALAVAMLAAATPVAAQDAVQHATPGAGSWAIAFGAGTDNRLRDISQSDGDAFVWGEAEWQSASGLYYAGPGFQTIKSPGGSRLELAVGVGARPQVGGFDLDLNLTHRYEVDAAPGFDAGAWEATADAHRSIGPASARLRLQYSPDGLGALGSWTWVEARLGWDFTDKLQATASIGRREQENSIDYTGWNAGVTYALTRNLEADLRYHATDADVPGEQYADAVVAGISIAF